MSVGPQGLTPPAAADLVAMLAGGMPRQRDDGTAECVTCTRVWADITMPDGSVYAAQERALSCSCGGGARLVIPGAVVAVAAVGAAIGDLTAAAALLAAREESAALALAAREKAVADREARVDAVLAELAARTVQVELVSNVPVPAITVAALGTAAADVALTWEHPFPDDAYDIFLPAVAASGLTARVTADLLSKTATGCTVRLTTTATLAAGRATVSALARRTGTTIPEEAA